MRNSRRNFTTALMILASLSLFGRLVPFTPSAIAQQIGTVSGTISSREGTPLANVKVTIKRGDTTQVQVTDGRGQFRSSGLLPGTYTLKAELEGFSNSAKPSHTDRHTVVIDYARTLTNTHESQLRDTQGNKRFETHNLKVRGSNPCGGTKINSDSAQCLRVLISAHCAQAVPYLTSLCRYRSLT